MGKSKYVIEDLLWKSTRTTLRTKDDEIIAWVYKHIQYNEIQFDVWGQKKLEEVECIMLNSSSEGVIDYCRKRKIYWHKGVDL